MNRTSSNQAVAGGAAERQQPTNPYAAQWSQFKANTGKHQLTVVHADGLYRHLRMAEPGTGIWSWNVVTWPGHLYIGGDIGQGFVFARELDMLAFMDTRRYGDYYGDGSPLLQADYWAEKLDRACHDQAYSWSETRFLAHVHSSLDGLLELDPETKTDLLAEAAEVANHEESAREWLNTHPDEFVDSWEWTLRAPDHHFLLACYAIAVTIRVMNRR